MKAPDLAKLSIRYSLAGISGSMTYFAFFGMFNFLSFHYLLSASLSWLAGIGVSYLSFAKIVWRRDIDPKSFIRFLGTGLGSGAMGLMALFTLVDLLFIEMWTAVATTTVLSMLLSILQNIFSFQLQRKPKK